VRSRMLLWKCPSSTVRCASGEPSCPGVAIARNRRGRGLTNPVFSYRLVPGAPPGIGEAGIGRTEKIRDGDIAGDLSITNI